MFQLAGCVNLNYWWHQKFVSFHEFLRDVVCSKSAGSGSYNLIHISRVEIGEEVT